MDHQAPCLRSLDLSCNLAIANWRTPRKRPGPNVKGLMKAPMFGGDVANLITATLFVAWDILVGGIRSWLSMFDSLRPWLGIVPSDKAMLSYVCKVIPHSLLIDAPPPLQWYHCNGLATGEGHDQRARGEARATSAPRATDSLKHDKRISAFLLMMPRSRWHHPITFLILGGTTNEPGHMFGQFAAAHFGGLGKGW